MFAGPQIVVRGLRVFQGKGFIDDGLDFAVGKKRPDIFVKFSRNGGFCGNRLRAQG